MKASKPKATAVLFSPTKLNLGLSIVGRQENGYHLLESLFWPLNFGDTLALAPSKEGNTAVVTRWAEDAPVTSPLPPEQDNLLFRFLKALPPKLGALQVTLTKRAPIGGGLGGGSANVGTLARWLRDRHPEWRAEVERAAVLLGADIPFFLDPRPSWVGGTGDRIQPTEAPGFPPFFLLVFPRQSCPTPEVFRRYRESARGFSTPNPLFGQPLSAVWESYLASAKNDLEGAAVQIAPEIQAVLGELRKTPCIFSGLSGSGSTCFAVYSTQQAREDSVKALDGFFRQNNCRSTSAQTYLENG